MRRLSKYMGAFTHSHLDRAVIARYFAFLVISQLLIFTLIGVGFSALMPIIRIRRVLTCGLDLVLDIIRVLGSPGAKLSTVFSKFDRMYLAIFFPSGMF